MQDKPEGSLLTKTNRTVESCLYMHKTIAMNDILCTKSRPYFRFENHFLQGDQQQSQNRFLATSWLSALTTR